MKKTEIEKIKLFEGSEYVVVKDKYNAPVIGYYLGKEKSILFKSYSYGHQSYGHIGGTTSLNKVATLNYYIDKGDGWTIFNP